MLHEIHRFESKTYQSIYFTLNSPRIMSNTDSYLITITFALLVQARNIKPKITTLQFNIFLTSSHSSWDDEFTHSNAIASVCVAKMILNTLQTTLNPMKNGYLFNSENEKRVSFSGCNQQAFQKSVSRGTYPLENDKTLICLKVIKRYF